jgi:hypothetical protein
LGCDLNRTKYLSRSGCAVLLAALCGFCVATEPAHFSGGGSLVEGASESADRRFAISGELQAGDSTQQGGRYSLDARLGASELAKQVQTACAANSILFSNGFE